MRIFAISDLHTDFQENWLFLREVINKQYEDDLLIVAGDISDNLEIIEKTLRFLKSCFKYVVFTPGNHELWVKGTSQKSDSKFEDILELCSEIKVETKPKKYSGVWVVPLFSWYETRNIADEISKDEYLNLWADFHLCKWSSDIECVSEYFSKMNEQYLDVIVGEVISFSHFLPTEKLLPDLSRIRFKGLAKVSVCPQILAQITKINSKIHIYGHTHINYDVTHNEVRYVQNALKYPKERKRSKSFKLKLITEI